MRDDYSKTLAKRISEQRQLFHDALASGDRELSRDCYYRFVRVFYDDWENSVMLDFAIRGKLEMEGLPIDMRERLSSLREDIQGLSKTKLDFLGTFPLFDELY